MKRYKLLFMFVLLAGVLGNSGMYSQVNWTAQYMGRAEYRHGFQSLASENQDPAFFLSQRARLGMKFNAEKFRIGVNIQDIRTWGSLPNNTIDAGGLLSVHEAWAEWIWNKELTLKFGRQEISYDEDRIFGTLDWAMQARRHDAAVFKFQDSLNMLHVGAAFNQDREQNNTTFYSVANNYKTFQYLYYQRLMKSLTISALVLNNGMQWKILDSTGAVDTSAIKFSQTAGARAVYKKNKFGANATFYIQFGKDANDKNLSAYEASLEFSYQVANPLKLVLGGELLSGTSQTDLANTDNHSFNPFYGTNHRFNGYMDYFYVGNHANSVGLQDMYFKMVFSKGKLISSLHVHGFMAAADVRDWADTSAVSAMSSFLGTEVDFTLLYNLTDFVALQMGYSHMLPTETLVAIKGGSTNATSNWSYFSILIRPGAAKFPKTGLKM